MMETKKLNNKTPTFSVMHVAFLLLCAVLLSAYAIGGLYARYSTGKTANDSARVAKFSVTAVATGNSELSVDLSTATELLSDSYRFTVSNNSEVRIAYTVTVTLPQAQALPTGVTMTMLLGGNEATLEKSSDGRVYTCSEELDFTETHECILIFTGDPELVTETADLKDITVNVSAEQID